VVTKEVEAIGFAVTPSAGHHQDWMRSDPPGVIFKRLGGVREARRLADEASTGLHLRADIELFQKAYKQGLSEGRWRSQNEMASFLEVDRNWLGRLIRGAANVANMKVRDLYRCASMLRVLLRIEAPSSPECIERHVLHVVVQAMREQRRNGTNNSWPDFGKGNEAETIRQWAQKVGYIDDGPAREASCWQQWLSYHAARMPSTEPKSDFSSPQLTTVGLGDWLAAQLYLPLFESWLYFKLRALEQLAKDRKDTELKNNVDAFLGPLFEAQEMLCLFRATKNRTVEEVAKMRNWPIETVLFRLRGLRLTALDFRGENAVLGRLIVSSPVLRPRFDGLLSSRYWSVG
jgi:hypothetical protein